MANWTCKVAVGFSIIAITGLSGMEVNAQSSELDALKARVAKLETRGKSAMKNIEFGGAVEFEAELGEDYLGNSYSDINVATVELAVDAAINSHVDAHVSFLYEEGEAGIDVDEAAITLVKGQGSPFSLTLGQLYLPFGAFETALINDTLTLEIGETLQTAAIVDYQKDALSGSFYVFDGEVDRPDNVETWGFSLGYATEQFHVGMDYISSIADTDALSSAIGTDIRESAEGVTLHSSFTQGDLTVLIEYLAAMDALELTSNLDIEPEAIHLEIDYGARVSEYDVTFALALQTTDEAAGIELSEERLSLGASIELFKATSLGFELWFDEDYSIADGGSGDESKAIICQLATEF